ncbi:MAG: type VI secretion system-associated protein TagF [Desulfobacteraceae bacterium]
MLGVNRSEKPWNWSVYGKHPSFNDYINHQTGEKLVHALSIWVHNGSKLIYSKEKSNSLYSYRFWVKGVKKNDLVCGIIKNSSDSIGRTYPLFITGHGRIHEWEKDWDIVFQVFDPLFEMFESLSAKRFKSFNEFASSLHSLRFNQSKWLNYRSIIRNTNRSDTGDMFPGYQEMIRLKNNKEPLKDDMTFSFIRKSTQITKKQKSGFMNKILNKKVPAPACAFIGGLTQHPVLKIYNRPLVPEDLSDLFKIQDQPCPENF